MMSRVVLVPGTLLMMLTTAACGGGFITGSGEIVTESREVDSFDSVELRGSADLTIEIGEETSVTVETDSAVIDRITTEVVDGRLIIDQESDRFLWVDRINIAVTMPSVGGIHLVGSGTVSADDLTGRVAVSLSGSGDIDLAGDVDHVDIALCGSGTIDGSDLVARSAIVGGDGSGDITVMVDGSDLKMSLGGSLDVSATGAVDTATIAIDGSGEISARDLTADAATVLVNGSGAVDISVADTLDATITGSGDIVYHGDPEVSRDVTGSGSVNRG